MKRAGFAVCIVAFFVGPAAVAIAAEPWVGRWSVHLSNCQTDGGTEGTTPLIVSDTTLRWSSNSCRVGKMYKTGRDAHIEAHCSINGKTATMPISLKPRGDRLTVIWDNVPLEEMRRCK
ncbi:MAG: hypothetical protein AB7K04_05800 [Pseudorhodoplanes sp.]